MTKNEKGIFAFEHQINWDQVPDGTMVSISKENVMKLKTNIASLSSEVARLTAEQNRLQEENSRLWELVENAHLKFHELMIFSAGAILSCELRGDKIGIETHDKLIEMGKASANDLFVYMDEHAPISSETSLESEVPND